MAKIRKNLSDADMLKGFAEELTFENGIYAEEKNQASKVKRIKASAKKELLLPDEAQERLNRFLLEISMEWLKNKNGNCTWKVLKEDGQIVIKPSPVAKK